MAKNKEHNPYGKVTHDRGTADRPAKYAGIGNEKHPNVKGAQEGGSRAEAAGTRGDLGPGHSHLRVATRELEAQHPHHHSVGGVHHTDDHVRHLPMGGLGAPGRHHNSAHMHAGRSHEHPEHSHKDLK